MWFWIMLWSFPEVAHVVLALEIAKFGLRVVGVVFCPFCSGWDLVLGLAVVLGPVVDLVVVPKVDLDWVQVELDLAWRRVRVSIRVSPTVNQLRAFLS